MSEITRFVEWLADQAIVLTQLSGIEAGEINMLHLAPSSAYELEARFRQENPDIGCSERHGNGSNRLPEFACILTGPHRTHQNQFGAYW